MPIVTLQPPQHPRLSYDMHIDSGAISRVPEIVSGVGSFDVCVILYDAAIEPIAQKIATLLSQSVLIAVQSGDHSKSLQEIERITQQMLAANCTRQTLLISVGGGMITDLGGLLGSLFMRGIPCIHVPTTLLGMVDAAIGGKTGVNVGQTKNILGTVRHPKAIIIDTDLLADLPGEQLCEGLVEVVKIAAMRDTDFFGWLEKHLAQVIEREPARLAECIHRAVALKARTVETDEADTQVRLFLNFGHTVGHAVETLSNFRLSHGKAVSIGMMAEMAIAQCEDRLRIAALLRQLSMPHALPTTYTVDQLWSIMRSDKKNVGTQVRIAIPERIGAGAVRSITLEEFSHIFSSL